jgi:hypothetical protein
MGTNPNLTFRKDLTDFAFGIMPDFLKILAEAKRIAPIVATGALAGRYASFNKQQGFVAPKTKRAIGGETAQIKFAAEMVDFVLDPNALKASVDQEIEVPLAGDNVRIVEESKVTTLLAQGTQSFGTTVYDLLKAGVSAHGTYGKWGDATVDPIAQLDAAGLEIAAATGIYPNVCDITPQMLSLLRANPLVRARFPGKSGAITLDDVAGCLSFPCTINVLTGMGLTGGGFGNSDATYAPLLGTSCWLYYSNPLATGQNPSFAVTLSYTPELISGVYEYINDDGTLKWFRIKWACKTVIQSASLARRIDKIA